MKTYEEFQKELEEIEYRNEQERMVEVSRLMDLNADVINKEVTRRQMEKFKRKNFLERAVDFIKGITTFSLF